MNFAFLSSTGFEIFSISAELLFPHSSLCWRNFGSHLTHNDTASARRGRHAGRRSMRPVPKRRRNAARWRRKCRNNYYYILKTTVCRIPIRGRDDAGRGAGNSTDRGRSSGCVHRKIVSRRRIPAAIIAGKFYETIE